MLEQSNILKKNYFNFMGQIKTNFQSFINIKVVGIGGAGGNAISRMQGIGRIRGVEFVAINTDTQDLHYTSAKYKLNIGKNVTRGMGTGMNPDIGRMAAEESKDEIAKVLRGSEMVFITAGFGGGTGSGASPIVAQIAKELGCLTVSVVTKPFSFEGIQRERIAQEAIENIRENTDALIIIKNDKIFSIIDKDTPLLQAFLEIDEILKSSVEGISDLITQPGIVNVDFADVKSVLENAGTALVGVGKANGEERARKAMTTAIESPLLENSIDGAKGILFNIGGSNLRMQEIQEAGEIIRERVDSEAKIIFGAFEDHRLKKNDLKITILATGFDNNFIRHSNRQSMILDILEKKDNPEKKSENLLEEKDKKNPKDTDKEERDIFEIPAFLRRKKKK